LSSPETLAGAGPCRDRIRVREDSAEQIVFLYDGESDMACPVGRQTLHALEDDAASPSKFDENGYLTDPASVPERNRPVPLLPAKKFAPSAFLR